MATWKYLDWLKAVVDGTLDDKEIYILHPYVIDQNRISVAGMYDEFDDASVDRINESVSVSTISDYYNRYVYNPDNTRMSVRGAPENVGQTRPLNEVGVDNVRYRVYFDDNLKWMLRGMSVYNFSVKNEDRTTINYRLPSRDLRALMSVINCVPRYAVNLDRSRVEINNMITSGRLNNVLPRDIVKVLNLEAFEVRLFVVNGYHDRSMRTNIERVKEEHFNKLDGEDTSNPNFTYVGLELEFMSRDRHNMSNERHHHNVFERLFVAPANEDVYNHFDVSTDSSLDDRGYEMVSLPMSVDYVKSKKSMFDKIYRHMSQNNMLYGGSTHIHFDRKYILGENDEYRDAVSYFMSAVWWSKDLLKSDEAIAIDYPSLGKINNEHMINVIAGRQPTSYCAYMRPIKDSDGSDHTNWVTVKRSTVEFRRFSTSINYDDLLNKILFVTTTANVIKKMVSEKSDELSIRRALRIVVNDFYLRKLSIMKDYLAVNSVAYLSHACMVNLDRYTNLTDLNEGINRQQLKMNKLLDELVSNAATLNQ